MTAHELAAARAVHYEGNWYPVLSVTDQHVVVRGPASLSLHIPHTKITAWNGWPTEDPS
ncbi:hypothetical protein ACQCSX_04295 [Pseudarthrobacter sp. P1]|uniref:hypothetical protein n=1 Tax=Pseudarthrobacter sp. P1 TaxID=3418418 RepID=UPI003CEA3F65